MNNKQTIKEKNAEYYLKTKELRKIRDAQYYLDNKERIKERKKKYKNERLKTDIVFYLKTKIRKRIYHILKNKGYNKNKNTIDILGCTIEEFKSHLESLFETWMTWDNYGKYNGTLNYGWDIDHIIPISLAKTEDEVINLNHYTNLRPLCSHTNRNIKRDNLNNN